MLTEEVSDEFLKSEYRVFYFNWIAVQFGFGTGGVPAQYAFAEGKYSYRDMRVFFRQIALFLLNTVPSIEASVS